MKKNPGDASTEVIVSSACQALVLNVFVVELNRERKAPASPPRESESYV
jgi:hypothetical protein